MTPLDPFSEAEAERRRQRTDDYETSREGAADVTIRATSQKARLLEAYSAGDPPRALSDEQAAQAAGLSMRSCFWKRCGELRDLGLIEFTGETVTGSAGSAVGLSRITGYGMGVAFHLSGNQSATVSPAPPEPEPEPAEGPRLFGVEALTASGPRSHYDD